MWSMLNYTHTAEYVLGGFRLYGTSVKPVATQRTNCLFHGVLLGFGLWALDLCWCARPVWDLVEALLQGELERLTQEREMLRQDLEQERASRRDAVRALADLSSGGPGGDAAPVQGLLDALHAARASATAAQRENAELRRDAAAAAGWGSRAGTPASQGGPTPRSQGGRARTPSPAPVWSEDGLGQGREESEREMAELRRDASFAARSRAEIRCLEREVSELTRQAERGAEARREVERLEREVGDLRWEVEKGLEGTREAERLREELAVAEEGVARAAALEREVRDLRGEVEDASEAKEKARRLEEELETVEAARDAAAVALRRQERRCAACLSCLCIVGWHGRHAVILHRARRNAGKFSTWRHQISCM